MTALVGRVAWTFAGFAVSMVAKFGTNLLLSRILMPEILGVMVIVNSIKTGLDLLTDVGIEQNIVHHHGMSSSFLNTAWTIQVVRGLLLTTLCLCLSPYLASVYAIPERVFFIISSAPMLSALSTTAVPMLVKNLDVSRRTIFEMVADCSTVIIYVTLALVSQSIWSVVTAAMLAIAARTCFTYFLPHPRHRFDLNRKHIKEILVFGRWIMISSLLMYATSNIDRIYLGQTISLSLLGVYGLARTISELPSILISRIATQIVFPMIVDMNRNIRLVRHELSSVRLKFMTIASLCLGTAAAWADWEIKILYDPRYSQAGWMLFILLLGAWPVVLSGLNEAILIGLGKPSYCSAANAGKLVALAVGLPLGFLAGGLCGSISAVIASDVFKYGVLLYGQRRIHMSFAAQDGLATILMIFTLLGWVGLRETFHLGILW